MLPPPANSDAASHSGLTGAPMPVNKSLAPVYPVSKLPRPTVIEGELTALGPNGRHATAGLTPLAATQVSMWLLG